MLILVVWKKLKVSRLTCFARFWTNQHALLLLIYHLTFARACYVALSYLERFTYCSVQDMLHGSLCRRRAIHHWSDRLHLVNARTIWYLFQNQTALSIIFFFIIDLIYIYYFQYLCKRTVTNHTSILSLYILTNKHQSIRDDKAVLLFCFCILLFYS